MNKTGRLIRNELIKKIKQPSTIIFIAIFIVISFALPFLSKLTNSSWQDYDRLEWDINALEVQIAYLSSEEMENIPDFVIGQYVNAIEYLKKAKSLNLSREDWRYQKVLEIYHLVRVNYELELILNDEIDFSNKEDLNWMENYSGYMRSYKFEEEGLENIQASFDENKKNIEESWKTVELNDYKLFSETLIQQNKEHIQSVEENINHIKKEIEENPHDKDLKGYLSELERQVQTLNFENRLLKYRIDNDIPYDGEWRDETLKVILSNTDDIYQNKSEIKYLENSNEPYNTPFNVSKDEHMKTLEKMIKTSKEFVETCWYSLDNDISMLQNANGSRRDTQTYFTMTIFAAVVAIFIASNIVSSEFSTKTINMLIIRPVKRWKIIAAKYIVALIFSYGIFIGGMFAYMLSTGLISGFSDYFIPFLYSSGGSVHKISFLLYMFGAMFFNSTNILFLVTVAFMASTVTKNTALSTISSMGVYFLGSVLNALLLYGVNMPIRIFKYTILPYLNLNEFMYVNDFMYKVLSPAYGAWQFVVLSAIMFAISAVVFVKRDVK